MRRGVGSASRTDGQLTLLRRRYADLRFGVCATLETLQANGVLRALGWVLTALAMVSVVCVVLLSPVESLRPVTAGLRKSDGRGHQMIGNHAPPAWRLSYLRVTPRLGETGTSPLREAFSALGRLVGRESGTSGGGAGKAAARRPAPKSRVPEAVAAVGEIDTGEAWRYAHSAEGDELALLQYRALLGTTQGGRDMARNIVIGLRYYIMPVVVACGFAAIAGILLGVIDSDWFSGIAPKLPLGRARSVLGAGSWLARMVASSLLDLLESLPKYAVILLALSMLAYFPVGEAFRDVRTIGGGPDGGGVTWYPLYWVAAMIAMLSVPRAARPVSQRIDAFVNRDFISAAEVLGVPWQRILGTHVLWCNMRGTIVTLLASLAAEVALVDASVAILSHQVRWSVQPLTEDIPSLGVLVSKGRVVLLSSDWYSQWWLWFFPLVAFMAWILGSYALGQRVKDLLAQSGRT